MQRYEKDIRSVVKHMLRSVTMMHIPVDYRQALQFMIPYKRFRGHRRVINYTESHAAIVFRMMPRRSDHGECGVQLARSNQSVRLHDRAG